MHISLIPPENKIYRSHDIISTMYHVISQTYINIETENEKIRRVVVLDFCNIIYLDSGIDLACMQVVSRK